MKRQPTRNRVNITAMCFSKMVTFLQNGGGTIREAAEELGICCNASRQYIWALYREKLVHVAGYGLDKVGRPHPQRQIWVWGPGKDAPYTGVPKEVLLQRKREWNARRKMGKLLHIPQGRLDLHAA